MLVMRRVILWTILLVIIAILGFFVWRVVYFYQAVGKGQKFDFSSIHFSTNTKLAATNVSGKEVKVDSVQNPHLGKITAPIKIVEFADFTCPFSKEVFPVVRELMTKYPDKIYFTMRFYSLGGAEHAGGKEAAQASLCALSQGKFWQYHDRLFLDQKNFSNDDLLNYAKQVGLDPYQFNACFTSKIVADWVDSDLQAGVAAGVRGTPTFFINGQKVEGSIPLEAWQKVLNLQ